MSYTPVISPIFYTLEWLYARQNWNLGLERITQLLELLGWPQDRFKTVLVGGTNGKGSCAATLERILHSGGQTTGLFTSPHLTYFAERFVVNGQMLPAAQIQAALERVGPFAEQCEASFFEIVTALACLLFAEAGVNWAVMEVGLGGRFDATNALEPELCIISNIALDHVAILGDTPVKIAFEKAGIMRPSKVCITGATGQGLAELERLAQHKGAKLQRLGLELRVSGESLGMSGSRVLLETVTHSISFETSLIGPHQIQNAALAAAAALELGVSELHIWQGASQTRHAGRLERIVWQGKTLLLDGAHNPDGAQALVSAVQTLELGKIPLIFGVAADKDIAQIAQTLEPIASEVILTRSLLSPRAALPETLLPYFKNIPARVAQTPLEALKMLPDSVILVAGSLYLIGEIRPIVLDQPLETLETLERLQ
jgi:dihydrofolate synthase / folylpolyglutamate synthase